MLLRLPTLSTNVPTSFSTSVVGDVWGHIGAWMAQAGRDKTTVMQRHWDPDHPSNSVKAAFGEVIQDSLGKHCDINLVISRNVNDLPLPDCFYGIGDEVQDEKNPLLLSVFYDSIHLHHAPKILTIHDLYPECARAIAEVINSGLAETVGDFGPGRGWYCAEYRFWCGEVGTSENNLAKADREVAELIEAEDWDPSTPLPSVVAKSLPFFTHGFSKKIKAITDCERSFPEVFALYEEAATELRKFRLQMKSKKRVNAWGYQGELNYHGTGFIGWTPQSKMDCDLNGNMVARLMDDYYQDYMNSGEAVPIMGIANISSAKTFKTWLENLNQGARVVNATINLLESLSDPQ